MPKLKAGDKVYVVKTNIRYNKKLVKESDIKEYFVLKVGRKYFTVWDGKHEGTSIQFEIDSMHNVSRYSPDYKAYISKQEIFDENEIINIRFDENEPLAL